jgi:hypothetical protein
MDSSMLFQVKGDYLKRPFLFHAMSDVSLRSDRRPPPPVAIVVTSPRESGIRSPYNTPPIDYFIPAWARDEPPSPTELIGSTSQPTESRVIFDTSSFQSNCPTSNPTSRWWSFTLRSRQESFGLLPHSIKPERKSVRDISLACLPPSSSMHEGYTFIRKDKEKEPYLPQLQVSVPTSSQTVTTPGWDIPWSSPSQPSAQDPLPQFRGGSPYGSEQVVTTNLSKWGRRKKQIRTFIIANTYAPLVRLSIISLLQNFH